MVVFMHVDSDDKPAPAELPDNSPDSIDTKYKDYVADLVFLIDDTSSITQEYFDRQIIFIMKIVQLFKIGPDAVRIAVVSYNADSKVCVCVFSLYIEFDICLVIVHCMD